MRSPLLCSAEVAAEAYVCMFLGLAPVREATNNNDGRFVNAIQRVTGTTTGAAWCDSTDNYVGVTMFGDAWPMPRTAACTESYAFAKKVGWLVGAPRRGDLFFHMTAPDQAHHTGVVVATPETDPSIPGGYVRIVAGNSGPADDQGVHVELMPVAQHTFARWTMGCTPAAQTTAAA